MDEKLTSRERILIAAKGGQPDRVPVAPMAWDYAAVFSGKSHREYTLDPKAMASCLLNYYPPLNRTLCSLALTSIT